MSRKALTPREVDEIVSQIRARPFALGDIADRFHVSLLTVERIARARGISLQHGAQV